MSSIEIVFVTTFNFNPSKSATSILNWYCISKDIQPQEQTTKNAKFDSCLYGRRFNGVHLKNESKTKIQYLNLDESIELCVLTSKLYARHAHRLIWSASVHCFYTFIVIVFLWGAHIAFNTLGYNTPADHHKVYYIAIAEVTEHHRIIIKLLT